MLDVERLQFLDLYSFELRLDYFEKILEFTSSSYSFYWLEAILNIMIYKDTIEFDEILDEMISLAYEDVVEKGYHLGPLIHQKRTNALENAILSIQKHLPENCSKQEIIICVKQHDVSAMADAINIDKVPCLGYTMWAPIDLVSLSTGEMTKRYGFVYVDMDDKGNGTLKRTPKKSYNWMKHIIETNGAALDK